MVAAKSVSQADVLAVLRSLCLASHESAVARGFYMGGSRSVGESLMFIVSEVSKAVPFVKRSKLREIEPGVKPRSFPTALARATIRIFDLSGYLGIDLAGAIVDEMQRNKAKAKK